MKKRDRIICILLAALLACALAACGGESAAETGGSLPAAAETAPEETAGALAVDPTGRREGYSAVLYDNTNGLPTSEANAIAMTSEGFLWIGSYSGLIRYDGNTFERIGSTEGIASVVSLWVDSRDRLWVGTNDSGVAVMEQGRFRMYTKADGLGSTSVRTVAETADGTIYAGTTCGVARIDGDMTLHPVDDPRINEAYVRELRLGPADVLYGVTMDGDVFTIQDGKVLDFYSGEDLGTRDTVLCVLPDPDWPGEVWLGTEGAQVCRGPLTAGGKNWQVIDVSPLASVKSLAHYGDQLWVCADNGIGIVENGAAQTLENIPLNNSIDHIMTDYEGNLWFTSSRQGVMKLVPNQFLDLFARYGLDSAVVNSTCLYRDRLFVGSDSGLMVLDEDGVVERLPLASAATASGKPLEADDLVAMLDGCRIRSVIRDGNGLVWFSTYSDYGLVRYNGSAVTCFTEDDGLPSDRVRTVAQREDGAVMAACNGGVAVIRGNRVIELYDEDDGLNNTAILTVAEGENGDMICGSDGDGIYVLRPGEQVRRLGTEAGLHSEIIMRIKKDPARDIFWIVTSNSIAYMTGDYRITTVDLFPYPNNFDLYENSKGDVWVLSSNGIYVVPVDELLANGAIAPVFYSRDNGLPCIATANSYSELTEDGTLYIAGTTGVAKVNIETPFESVSDLKLAVPFVEADGEFLYPGDDGVFAVPAGVQKLTVYSYVYTYSLLNPQVTYRLEGFEEEGTTVSRTDLGPVDYTNLGGGSYRFVVQLKDSLGRGNKELSVPIVKQKTFRERVWFKVAQGLLGVAVAAGLVQLYFYRKTKALEKKHQENRAFIREMTEAFAKIIDMKDKYTNGHSTRVAKYTTMLARELGCDEETVEKYYYIALLHDIGKIGIPPEVLNKPGKLTDEEFRVIQSHSAMGYDALKDISIIPELATGAGAHHERPDGKGYPRGLRGDDIPRVARIIAVADAFDAMYSNRPYRKRMNFDRAVSIIRDAAGTQFSEDVVEAFLRLAERGELRAPDDDGGGSMEDIDNIHRSFDGESE